MHYADVVIFKLEEEKMLTENECVKIAQKACIDMFGKEFVNDHKDGFSSTRYQNPDTGQFEYSLLYAPLYKDNLDERRLRIDKRLFDYYASVLVDMRTGEVNIDPDDSKTKLPV